MISTNPNLPLHIHNWHPLVQISDTKWQDVCVDCGEHRIIDSKTHEEFQDEASGIHSLDARQETRGGLAIVVGLLATAVAIGMVIGAAIATGLFVCFNNQ